MRALPRQKLSDRLLVLFAIGFVCTVTMNCFAVSPNGSPESKNEVKKFEVAKRKGVEYVRIGFIVFDAGGKPIFQPAKNATVADVREAEAIVKKIRKMDKVPLNTDSEFSYYSPEDKTNYKWAVFDYLDRRFYQMNAL